MPKNSFGTRVWMALAGGLLFSAFVTTQGAGADAAEVKVLTSVALTSALDELAPQFERATGNKLAIGYGLIAEIRKRILDGESADVIIHKDALDFLAVHSRQLKRWQTDTITDAERAEVERLQSIIPEIRPLVQRLISLATELDRRANTGTASPRKKWHH